MGQHALSVRLRIYLLLAIPLLTVAGLYAFVLVTTVGDAINLDRAPSLINATSVPAAVFDTHVQDERRASLVYLADPAAANRARLTAAQDATIKALPVLRAKLTSPATTANATAGETAAIHRLLADAGSLGQVRARVRARTISSGQAFSAFNAVMADEFRLFLAETVSLTDAHAAIQALANVDTVQAREYLLQEDALVSASLAAHTFTPAARAEITQLAGARRSAQANAEAAFDTADLAAFEGPLHTHAPAAMLSRLTSLESTVAAGHGDRPPFTAAQWDPVVKAVSAGYFAGGVNTAEMQVRQDRTVTNAAWLRVALAGGLGLAGLAASIIVSGLVARGIIRRLDRLGQSALTLANEQLPDVVARLRRGEDVGESEAVPPVESGADEIGRVGHAFDLARRTAIQAAVDEATLRRGVNQVFRNLARRSQSLLHRQLALLDAMERRASDPGLLDDLFRLDHLTTRMRRHAEGLIILSGAPPGRGWVHPVRLVDVLRGAAAEVEDYSRVSVVCASPAALAGPVVADVIHLLAELIENATTLSPPYTSVRVSGDLVAKGFVVEVEDRGLGLSEKRLAELNARLADPPEFNPSDSERLGLFVVGQLAKRHGIQVSLRPSPYGGITAITLVPADLVVLGDEYAGGLPAGAASAWGAGHHRLPGGQAAEEPAPSGPPLTVGRTAGALTGAPGEPVPPDGAIAVPGQGFDAFSPSADEAPLGAHPTGVLYPAHGHRPTDGDTYRGLPRRVRQASLAPQLRGTEPPGGASRSGRTQQPARHTGQDGTGPDSMGPDSTGPDSTGPDGEPARRSPESIRATMSAMQRGWEQVRAPWDAAPPPGGAGGRKAPDGSASATEGTTGHRPQAGEDDDA